MKPLLLFLLLYLFRSSKSKESSPPEKREKKYPDKLEPIPTVQKLPIVREKYPSPYIKLDLSRSIDFCSRSLVTLSADDFFLLLESQDFDSIIDKRFRIVITNYYQLHIIGKFLAQVLLLAFDKSRKFDKILRFWTCQVFDFVPAELWSLYRQYEKEFLQKGLSDIPDDLEYLKTFEQSLPIFRRFIQFYSPDKFRLSDRYAFPVWGPPWSSIWQSLFPNSGLPQWLEHREKTKKQTRERFLNYYNKFTKTPYIRGLPGSLQYPYGFSRILWKTPRKADCDSSGCSIPQGKFYLHIDAYENLLARALSPRIFRTFAQTLPFEYAISYIFSLFSFRSLGFQDEMDNTLESSLKMAFSAAFFAFSAAAAFGASTVVGAIIAGVAAAVAGIGFLIAAEIERQKREASYGRVFIKTLDTIERIVKKQLKLTLLNRRPSFGWFTGINTFDFAQRERWFSSLWRYFDASGADPKKKTPVLYPLVQPIISVLNIDFSLPIYANFYIDNTDIFVINPEKIDKKEFSHEIKKVSLPEDSDSIVLPPTIESL